jgi:hypothetical protein
MGEVVMNVVFEKPYLRSMEDGNVRLCCDITGLSKDVLTIWYEVSKQYGDYLCTERSDAFVIGMLPYLLSHSSNEDRLQVICQAPLSERICYQLTHAMIPTLVSAAKMYHPVDIICEVSGDRLPNANAVGTGVSGGVDSFYTLITNTSLKTPHYNLTHGMYCDMAMYGNHAGEGEQQRYEMASNICREMGIEPLKLSSNICIDVYRIAHDAVVTFMFASAILALQKLFSVYYISSAYSFSDFGVNPHSCPQFDLLSVYCFSTETLSFFSTGGAVGRLQKVKRIANSPVVQKHLNVCVTPINNQRNCSRCSKCSRTMLELYANGDLDQFKDVFDVVYFKSNPNYYFGYMFMKGHGDHFMPEIFTALKQNGIKVPFSARWVGLYKLMKNGFHRTNPLATRYRP